MKVPEHMSASNQRDMVGETFFLAAASVVMYAFHLKASIPHYRGDVGNIPVATMPPSPGGQDDDNDSDNLSPVDW